MRYKKVAVPLRNNTPTAMQPVDTLILGMLYIVDVLLSNGGSGERTRHKLLMVGCEAADIERKLSWIFDPAVYGITLKGFEKVREKVHFLSTVVTQPDAPVGPVIAREERSQIVPQQKTITEPYDPKLYAIGITTTMLAKDQEHALRKLGHALVAQGTEGKSHSGASLSSDSTVVIEAVPMANGYASARDVSNESNRAHVMRG